MPWLTDEIRHRMNYFFSSLRDFLEKKSIGRTTSVTIKTSTELVRKRNYSTKLVRKRNYFTRLVRKRKLFWKLFWSNSMFLSSIHDYYLLRLQNCGISRTCGQNAASLHAGLLLQQCSNDLRI